MMKAAFLGTPASAVPSLAGLADVVDIELVVTRPDAAINRSKNPQPPPVKVAAMEWGLEIVQPKSGAELLLALKNRDLDVGVVVAYGHILTPKILARTRMGFVNIHFSLLPRWRGPAPVERAILSGDTATGVSLMSIDDGIDTGPVIAIRETQIDPDETAGSLTKRLSFMGAELLKGTLGGFLSGVRRPAAQIEAGVTKAPPLTTAEACLQIGESVDTASRKIRAYNPRPGAWINLGSTRLKIWSASKSDIPLAAGHIDVFDGMPHLGLPGGSLRLERVQPAGKISMKGDEWWIGRHIDTGPVTIGSLG